jgi:hypothetical protein
MENEETRFLLKSSVISSKSYNNSSRKSGFQISPEEPQSLIDKKQWYEKSKILKPIFQSMITKFTSAEIDILEELGRVADENFEINNLNHLRHLKTLYNEVFGLTKVDNEVDFISNESVVLQFKDLGKEYSEVIKNKNWELLGFQCDTPGTDFRGGGLLSLLTLIIFAKKERVLVKDILEYKKKEENYLFACSVISAVFFVKNFFHFGVWSNYRQFMKKKLASRKLCKMFLALSRSLESEEDRVSFFINIAIIYVKKIFIHWRFLNMKKALTIVDFKAVEQSFENKFRSKIESLRKQGSEILDASTFLKKIEEFKF